MIPAAPETDDPAALMRHLEAYEPVKLALARDFPLVVHKLKKNAKGIKKMETEGNGDLHKGLGWLHYRGLSLSKWSIMDRTADRHDRNSGHLCHESRLLHPLVCATCIFSTRSVKSPNSA